MECSFYLKKLKEDFSRRQRANPAYSLRAYAKTLGVPPTTLSQVLLGKRPLPIKSTRQVLDRIPLNARDRTLFLSSLEKKQVSLDQIQIPTQDSRFILDEVHYQIISEWEHYAVLMLFDCKDFCSEIEYLSDRLGISIYRAETVVDNLIVAGLMTREIDGRWKRTHSSFRSTEDISSQALKLSHRESLEKAKKMIDETSIDYRDFSTLAVAIDLNKIPEAKAIIREFRQKMAKLMSEGERTEVYELAIQLYPITRLRNPELQVNRSAPLRRKK